MSAVPPNSIATTRLPEIMAWSLVTNKKRQPKYRGAGLSAQLSDRVARMVGAKRQMFATAQPAPLVGNRLAQAESKIGFYLVMLAMLFEFGRPQDLFPPLKVVPIPTLIDVSLAFAVFMSGKANFSNKQTKLFMALLVVMALWVPFANNNFHALMTFKDMTLCFFFYLGIVAFVNTTQRMHKLILMWLAVHTVLAINGLLHGGAWRRGMDGRRK